MRKKSDVSRLKDASPWQAVGQTQPWNIGFQSYLGPCGILKKGPQGLFSFSNARRQLERQVQASKNWKSYALFEHPDVEAKISPGGLSVLTCNTSGEVIGGSTSSMMYVEPPWRERGLCSALYMQMDLVGCTPRISGYSEAGFYARLRAHRLHIVRALLEDLAIPHEVLGDYTISEEGFLRLLTPYNPADHQAWLMASGAAYSR